MEMVGHSQRLTSLGHALPPTLMALIIITALPPSYDTLQTILTSKASKLDLDETISLILADETRRKETSDTALKARDTRNPSSSQKKTERARKTCTNPNCGRTGHTIEQCWAEGGGQEGMGPRRNTGGSGNGAGGRTGTGAKVENVKVAEVKEDPTSDDVVTFVACDDDGLMLADQTGPSKSNTSWILDSGASAHMTAHRSWFSSYRTLATPRKIHLGDDGVIDGIGIGTIIVRVRVSDRTSIIRIENVLHVPLISCNLLSIPQLVRNGFDTSFGPTGASIRNRSTVSFMPTEPSRAETFIPSA